MELFNIAEKPRDHGNLRRKVCDSMMDLPQTPEWIKTSFNNSKEEFLKFIERHRRMGTWTDDAGIMCQATALYLGNINLFIQKIHVCQTTFLAGRNIHIVGTANRGQGQPFTKLEAGEEADKLQPLYVGYYQNKHYQSLEKIDKEMEDEDHFIPAPSFDTAPKAEIKKLSFMSTNCRVHNPADVLTVSNGKTLSPPATIKRLPGPRFTKLVSLNSSALKLGLPLSKASPVSGITGTNNKPIRVIKLTPAQAEALKRGRAAAAGHLTLAKDKLLMFPTRPASVGLDTQDENGVNKENGNMFVTSDLDSTISEEPKQKIVKLDNGNSPLSNKEELKKKAVEKDEVDDEDDVEDVDNPTNPIPSIDELLAIPEQERDEDGKTMDELLDEADEEIAKRQENHKKAMESADRWMKNFEQERSNREARYIVNAGYRDRLAVEITQPVLRKMFDENIDYLKSIRDGQTESSRHTAFHKDAGSRQALLYIQIHNPFTDAQVDWTLECMADVWMKTWQERADNLDYVSKVLMPECLIKFYMDFFKISKAEAETKIKETPIEDEDNNEDEDGVDPEKSTRSRRNRRGQGRGGGRGRGGGARRGARGGARGPRGGAQVGARGRGGKGRK